MKETKKATVGIALIPSVFLIGALILTISQWGGRPHIPIFTSAIVAAIVAMVGLNYSWKEIEEGIVDSIKMSMGGVLTIMVIGIIIGVWILAGIVPTMMYHGLKILSPSVLLPATLLICSLVSFVMGSVWGTVATVGIALMGIGMSFGIPAHIIAGAIISGAYFGDKMSAISVTTNLATSKTGTSVSDHVKHMISTTGPSWVITAILFIVIGMRYTGGKTEVEPLLTTLSDSFNLSPILFLVPIFVIVLLAMKKPAIPSLFAGAVLGGLFAAMLQGAGMSDIVGALHYGYESATGVDVLDGLLSRGGMDSMMGAVSLIFSMMAFAGVMERTGMFNAIAEQLLALANNTGSLVFSTVLASIVLTVFAGDRYRSMMIISDAYKESFTARGLHTKNLSRALGDSAALTSPLVPWSTCGAFLTSALAIAPWTYVPYCFLNILNPLISIFYGFTGITMEKVQKPETQNI